MEAEETKGHILESKSDSSPFACKVESWDPLETPWDPIGHGQPTLTNYSASCSDQNYISIFFLKFLYFFYMLL